jgi:hypothetical protein
VLVYCGAVGDEYLVGLPSHLGGVGGVEVC